MTGRSRRLVGSIGLILFLIVYALAAMALGAAVLEGTSRWTQFAYQLVAGFLWVIPAGAIVLWMYPKKNAEER